MDAARGLVEYFDVLDARHHPDAAPEGRPQRVREALRAAQVPALSKLLQFLEHRSDIHLRGPARVAERAATVAFVPRSVEPQELGAHLARRGFMIGFGGFYAVRLLQTMNVDPVRGIARISFVHYMTCAEVEGLTEALEASLAG